jgi:hypothetical protein
MQYSSALQKAVVQKRVLCKSAQRQTCFAFRLIIISTRTFHITSSIWVKFNTRRTVTSVKICEVKVALIWNVNLFLYVLSASLFRLG